MTIGERNKYIIRLHDTGTPTKEIAERLKVTEVNVNKIIQRYKTQGDKMFESEKEHTPETEYEENLTDREKNKIDRINAYYEFSNKIGLIRDTICEGEKVKFSRDDKVIHGTVCDIKDHVVVIKDLSNPPCIKCEKGGTECEGKCRKIYHPQRLFDICRIYWQWFNRQQTYSPTYEELARGGKNV